MLADLRSVRESQRQSLAGLSYQFRVLADLRSVRESQRQVGRQVRIPPPVLADLRSVRESQLLHGSEPDGERLCLPTCGR